MVLIDANQTPAVDARRQKPQWVHHDELPAFSAVPGITLRVVAGERLMTAWIRMAPNTTLPVHDHHHEQLGVLVEGALTLTIDGETRSLHPGHAYTIPSHLPHGGQTGEEGCLLIESFSPPRDDYLAHAEAALAASDRKPR